MFLLNSCLGLFSAASSRRRPFSRSYGAILPSSLTMLLPSAWGFSPCPPVSVSGTGAYGAIAAFPGMSSLCFPTFISVRVASPLLMTVFPVIHFRCLHRFFLSRLTSCSCVPAVLTINSTGISTCYPSATLFSLTLGPDSPRADQLYPGNLGHPAWRIPTSISLLIPAFSLPGTPPFLPVRLLCAGDAPLPRRSFPLLPGLRRCVSAPDIFGAGPLGQ